MTTVPFRYQTYRSPVAWWCHRMSCWPSLLKSATPRICHLVSENADGVRYEPAVVTVP